MKITYAIAALALVTATPALAQQSTDKAPGGNIATAQGPCARGYEASVQDGRMLLSPEKMRAIDTNNDGRISKAEFDSACARKLFEQDVKSGG